MLYISPFWSLRLCFCSSILWSPLFFFSLSNLSLENLRRTKETGEGWRRRKKAKGILSRKNQKTRIRSITLAITHTSSLKENGFLISISFCTTSPFHPKRSCIEFVVLSGCFYNCGARSIVVIVIIVVITKNKQTYHEGLIGRSAQTPA